MSFNVVVVIGVELVLVLSITKNLSFQHKGRGNRTTTAATITRTRTATGKRRSRNVIDLTNSIREKRCNIVIVQVMNCHLLACILFFFFVCLFFCKCILHSSRVSKFFFLFCYFIYKAQRNSFSFLTIVYF